MAKQLTNAEFAALGGWKETTFTKDRKQYEQKLRDKGYVFEQIKEGRKIVGYLLEEKVEANLKALSPAEQIEELLGYKAQRPAYTLKYLKFIHENYEEFQWLTDAQVAAKINISEKHVQAIRSELVPRFIFPNAAEYKYFYRNRSTNYSSPEISYDEYRAAQWAWTNEKHRLEHELRSQMYDNTPIVVGDTHIIYHNNMSEEDIQVRVRELAKAFMVDTYGGYPSRVPKKETSFGLEQLLEKLFA